MKTVYWYLTALAAVLALAGSAAAAPGDSAVIADLENGTNENNFQAYWYLYDDCADGGTSVITNAAQYNAALCGTGRYGFLPTAAEGNPQGTPGFVAKVIWDMGTNKPSCGPACSYGQMVGIGTQLAKGGSVYDLTGATKISFYAKATAAIKLRIEICQSTVTNFAYHRATKSLSTSWTRYEVVLQDGLGVSQPSWNTVPVALDLSKIEKIQFQVSMEEDGVTDQGTLWLDDIVVHGVKFRSPDLIAASQLRPAGSAASIVGAMLSDMNTRPYNQNALGYYWYCYNDAAGRTVTVPGVEFSEIIEGAVTDPTDVSKPAIVIDGHGYDGTNGAYVRFQLGPTYTENGTTIKPFVGVGTRLADNLRTTFFNAATAGATGVYFDYMTSPSVDYLRLEVKANQTFPNAGIVHYVLVPGTNGAWQGVLVPWSALRLPDWEEVRQLPPSLKALKLSELEQFQWAFQGTPGTQGFFAVDNVLLAGATMGVRATAPRGLQNRGGVSQQPGAVVIEGAQTAALLDVTGRTVARGTTSGDFVRIQTTGLAPGRYVLAIDGVTQPFNAPVVVTP